MTVRWMGAALLAAAAGAHADDRGAHGVGLRLGTGGIGIEYGYGIGARIDLRAGYAFGRLSRTAEVDDIDYETEYRVGALFGMLDLRPFASGFRISVGGYSQAPSVDFFTVADNDEYQIGNSRYTADGRLDGDVDLGAFTPYAGIGWGGSTAGEGFGFSVDAGLMFADAPRVRLAATGRACDSSLVACDPASPIFGFDVNSSDARAVEFQDALEQERRNYEKDIERERYWPVLSVGLHYRF